MMPLLEAISPPSRQLLAAKDQHIARLRELQRRFNACEESGNSDGGDNIQKLIDQENERWSQIENNNQK